LSNPSRRRPWTEGPDAGAPPESWLLLDDDVLLHRIETLPAEHEEDERLLEVVASDRHFFIRQEAAKRVQDRDRLFDFEDDRHVGQILVRHLNRREDVTYLERLSKRSTHVEVRSAAQVQIARLWHKLDAPRDAGGLGGGLGAPQSPSLSPAAETPAAPPPVTLPPVASSPAEPSSTPPSPVEPSSQSPPPVEPLTSAPVEKGGVDGSLLAWAAHFLVEPSWSQLGTPGTRDLLTRTRRELLGRHPTLVYFEVTPDAHVTTNLDGGPRLPADSIRAVAVWMVAFRAAVSEVSPTIEHRSVRAATVIVADALRDIGFYAACDEAESALAG
jgi:hypothetical protein